jgi:hypothetical protein
LFIGLFCSDAYGLNMVLERNKQAIITIDAEHKPEFKKMLRWGILGRADKAIEKLEKGYSFTEKKSGMKCKFHLSIFHGELECKF